MRLHPPLLRGWGYNRNGMVYFLPRWFVIFTLCIAFLGMRSIALAAPSISGTSGTWTHNGTVTMSGAGFGTKSPAAPLIWDNASGSSLTEKWDGYWPSGSGASYNLAYRIMQRSVAMPHSHITKYIAGAAYPGTDTDQGWATTMWKNVNLGSLPKTVYISHYFRVDPAWVFHLGEPDDSNFKIFDISQGNGPYGYPPGYWYWNYQGDQFTSCSAIAPFQLQDDLSDSIDGGAYWGGSGTASPCMQWIKWEFETKLTSASNGYAKLWQDGTLAGNYAGKTDGFSGTTRTLSVGGYQRAYGNQNNWRYWADVYVDITPQRVILANNSTLNSSATIREIQIPTAWSDGSITVTVNLGKFTSGTAYLFVADATGAFNSTGMAITIGSGGSDTTPPAAPTALGVQ